jgi:hypothetical protein
MRIILILICIAAYVAMAIMIGRILRRMAQGYVPRDEIAKEYKSRKPFYTFRSIT